MSVAVKYVHVTNPDRTGQCPAEVWDEKMRTTNLRLYWKEVGRFEKKVKVPKEAQEIIDKTQNIDDDQIDI